MAHDHADSVQAVVRNIGIEEVDGRDCNLHSAGESGREEEDTWCLLGHIAD